VAGHELSLGAPWSDRDREAMPDSVAGPGAPCGEPMVEGDRPASGPPSADRIAACTAVGVHGYAQLLLRLLAVAQGSHARGLDPFP
jgi:hypothetical protein